MDSTESSNRKRLLFLCHNFPYPPDSGAKIRSYHILRILASRFDVTAMFMSRGLRSTPEHSPALPTPSEMVNNLGVFPIPQESRKLRFFWDHIRSLTFHRVYTSFAYQSNEFERLLHQQLKVRDFDLAHVESLDLARYLPAIQGIPVVCDHHNVESRLLRQRAGAAGGGVLGRYLKHQAHLMEIEERFWGDRVDLNLLCSEEDRQQFLEICPGAPTLVVPNGVDTGHFRRTAVPREGLLFLGGHDWFPNREGMEFFATRILPTLRRGHPGLRVTWLGSAPAEVRRSYRERYRIHLPGHVADVRPFLSEAECMVVPLLTGGGTRLKILEAWSMALPVVSTSVGCEGLIALDGKNILVRDGAASFAEGVSQILEDPRFAETLGTSARATALRHYDWMAVGENLLAGYGPNLQGFNGPA